MSQDNLERAQRIVNDPAGKLFEAQTLALIDIAHSLRMISNWTSNNYELQRCIR